MHVRRKTFISFAEKNLKEQQTSPVGTTHSLPVNLFRGQTETLLCVSGEKENCKYW